MAIHLKDSTAVLKNGDRVTLILETDKDIAREIREVLAKVNASGTGNPSPELRQLLNDLEAALQEAFRVRPRKRTTPPLRKVCEIPDCGCSGYAHA